MNREEMNEIDRKIMCAKANMYKHNPHSTLGNPEIIIFEGPKALQYHKLDSEKTGNKYSWRNCMICIPLSEKKLFDKSRIRLVSFGSNVHLKFTRPPTVEEFTHGDYGTELAYTDNRQPDMEEVIELD